MVKTKGDKNILYKKNSGQKGNKRGNRQGKKFKETLNGVYMVCVVTNSVFFTSFYQNFLITHAPLYLSVLLLLLLLEYIKSPFEYNKLIETVMPPS